MSVELISPQALSLILASCFPMGVSRNGRAHGKGLLCAGVDRGVGPACVPGALSTLTPELVGQPVTWWGLRPCSIYLAGGQWLRPLKALLTL